MSQFSLSDIKWPEKLPHSVGYATAALAGLWAVSTANKIIGNVVAGNKWTASQAAALWNWPEEIVLITGGAAGMGRLMAEDFSSRGIRVVVLDIAGPKDGLSSMGKNITFYQTDITDDDAVAAVAEKIRKEVGDPTVLINNAGIGHGMTLLDTPNEKIRQVFAVNAIAPMVMIRAFLPAMVKRNHGHVVQMASMASFAPIASNIDYSCTKASVMALHEGLRQELKHRYNAPEVKTTIVHPFWVQTQLLQNLSELDGFKDPIMPPEFVAKTVVKQVLSGRSGRLILPKSMSNAPLGRALPTWIFEKILDGKADTMHQ